MQEGIDRHAGWSGEPGLGLFTDLYELTMLQACFEEGWSESAVFSPFVRRLPERRNDPAARDVSLIWVGGLALDVCVQATAREARAHGFEVVLIEAATRPVSAADGEAAIRRLREDGVEVLPDE